MKTSLWFRDVKFSRPAVNSAALALVFFAGGVLLPRAVRAAAGSIRKPDKASNARIAAAETLADRAINHYVHERWAEARRAFVQLKRDHATTDIGDSAESLTEYGDFRRSGWVGVAENFERRLERIIREGKQRSFASLSGIKNAIVGALNAGDRARLARALWAEVRLAPCDAKGIMATPEDAAEFLIASKGKAPVERFRRSEGREESFSLKGFQNRDGSEAYVEFGIEDGRLGRRAQEIIICPIDMT